MDVAVLQHLCGLPHQRIARILGITPALSRAADHHARATVEALLNAPTTE